MKHRYPRHFRILWIGAAALVCSAADTDTANNNAAQPAAVAATTAAASVAPAKPVAAPATQTLPTPTREATAKLVPSTNTTRVQAWKDAELVASMGEGRASAAGSGGSMQPVFGSNTMVVISKIAYEDLKPGMTVAYMSRKGHQVVHQILEKKARGWRVQGLNNENVDQELVTRENLLGVIYASFAAEEP
ncbi:MAG: S24/S26 family peptidase [Verrucomicrobia bacterium]|nr:S24/S26 family peptidase [Verrucomicrobiota bacterium]